LNDSPAETKAVPTSRIQPCPCGSGLRYKYCCGLTALTLPRTSEIEAIEPVYREGRSCFEQQRFEEAEKYCHDILSHAPGHVRSLRLLADIRRRENRLDTVEILLKRAVKLLPNDVELCCELSLLLYEKGARQEAKQYARDAIRQAPENPQAHNLMGMILTEMHDYPPGEFHYRRALELHPAVGKLCANLGLNLKNQGKLTEAREWYQKAMELEPDNVDSLLGWVRMEETARQLDKADEYLQMAEKIKPGYPGAMSAQSVMYRRRGKLQEALAVLDKLEKQYAGGTFGAGYFYDRGEVLDKLGRYDESFEAFTRANEAIREIPEREYKKANANNLVERLKNFFTRERLNKLPRAEPPRPEQSAPIFIVGFPRSGTTMVEQILTSHPNICAGDELKYIGELTRVAPQVLNSNLAYPECLVDLWLGENRGALDALRDYYLKKVELQGNIIQPGVSRFTDKMPLNETHLGFINLIFPHSPIIHLIRHPLDVVCSSYFTDFTHGFNCSYGLDTIAEHYVLVRGLMDHYLENMDINYLAIRYEDIVADVDGSVRKLLDFVGEDWDEHCLNFHENLRYARTASYAQVTEKLYTRSVNRYQNYRQHLDEVIPMLEPAILKLGYQVD